MVQAPTSVEGDLPIWRGKLELGKDVFDGRC
jgi:hypothetical protein